MAVTAVSWWLGTDHGMTPTAPESEQNWNQVTVFVLALAFVKAWLVIRWFMDIRHAPPLLRYGLDAWVVVACVLLVGLYITAGG